MPATVNLQVTLRFVGDKRMTKAQKKAVVENVKRALYHEVESGMGIVPDDYEGHTKTVTIIDNSTGNQLFYDFVTKETI